jgi:hypothetical protein
MIFSGSLHLFSDFLSTRPSVFLSAELNIISAHPRLTVFFWTSQLARVKLFGGTGIVK